MRQSSQSNPDGGHLSKLRKSLMLNSFSSNAQSNGIPIEETLEEALIDLYLSVKIRSNDEVSFSKIQKFRSITTTRTYSRKRETNCEKQMPSQYSSM